MDRRIALLAIAASSLVACGDETSSPGTTAPPTTATTAPTSTTATTSAPPGAGTTSPPTTATPAPTTSSVPAGDRTPGLWPPDGAERPEDAVSAFVRDVFPFPVEPNLGEFRAGDSRSGEIDVLGPEEAPGVRATAFVRQLGPEDAWYVIGAASEGVEITAPETGATVPAAPLTVEGLGRGFESTINVRALLAGDGTELDSAIGVGGPFGDLEPYEVELDLSDAAPGDTVVLVARGDTGLGNDTGEFTAIGVTIG